jgi:hypothetical protein
MTIGSSWIPSQALARSSYRVANGLYQLGLHLVRAVGVPALTLAPPQLTKFLLRSDDETVPSSAAGRRGEFYAPFPAPETGREFLVPLYDDATPPPKPPALPLTILLLPSAAYPFQPETPVLRGRLQDARGRPVAGALVVETTRERVLSDQRGVFALPLRSYRAARPRRSTSRRGPGRRKQNWSPYPTTSQPKV